MWNHVSNGTRILNERVVARNLPILHNASRCALPSHVLASSSQFGFALELFPSCAGLRDRRRAFLRV